MFLLLLSVVIVLFLLFFNSSKRYLNHAVLLISLPVVLVDAIDYVVKPSLLESLLNQMINSLEIHIHYSKQVLMSYQGVIADDGDGDGDNNGDGDCYCHCYYLH